MEEDRVILQDITDHNNYMYQVSTLQALVKGYIKKVVSVGDLIKHGNTGLGTFEDLNGEMIVIDGKCYQAVSNGNVNEVDPNYGVPFAVVSKLSGSRSWDWGKIDSSEDLVKLLNAKIEEHFGLNSMHIVRIDGLFDLVDARSEDPSKDSKFVDLKVLLDTTQQAFCFENIKGSLVCLYFPDYMDGINLPGWHLHFISEDRTKGGHVFDIKIKECHVMMDKVSKIELQLPTDVQFDIYDLKKTDDKDVKDIEQGKK